MQELNMSPRSDAGKFGYHLKTLVESGLVSTVPASGKYALTDIGKIMAELIWEIEEISRKKSKRMLVRTSSLTMEPFERRKIVEALIREANAPRRIAEAIAKEAEERLLKLEISYLTAPLIREFVNAILLEQGLEDYRHSMTRLGLPVYDVEKLLEEEHYIPTFPDKVHAATGDAVMSEYALIKQLPRRVSDAHLAGMIHICNTNYWMLRPATIHHDLSFFLKKGFEVRDAGLTLAFSGPPKSLRAALLFAIRLAHLMQSNLAVGQLIDNVNYILAPYASNLKIEEMKKAVREALLYLNQTLTSRGSVVPLAFGLTVSPPKYIEENYNDYIDEAISLFKAILQAMYEGDFAKKPFISPLPIIKICGRMLSGKEDYEEILEEVCKLTSKWATPYFINLNAEWQTREVSYGWDLSRLEAKKSEDAKYLLTQTGCLDTVIINLPRIALEANGDDEEFFSKLKGSISLAVETLNAKRESIDKQLEKGHLSLLNIQSGGVPYYHLENTTCNIGYIGMPEAVKIHVGTWVHEDVNALSFAEKIVDFMLREIRKRRGRWTITCISLENASERLLRTDIARFGLKRVQEEVGGELHYTHNMHVPMHAQVPLSRRIAIESRFQKKLNGGHGLNIYLREPMPDADYLIKCLRSIATRTDLGAFTLTRDWTYCKWCGKLFGGFQEKCLNCGRSLKNIIHYTKMVNVYEVLIERRIRRVKYAI